MHTPAPTGFVAKGYAERSASLFFLMDSGENGLGSTAPVR